MEKRHDLLVGWKDLVGAWHGCSQQIIGGNFMQVAVKWMFSAPSTKAACRKWGCSHRVFTSHSCWTLMQEWKGLQWGKAARKEIKAL